MRIRISHRTTYRYDTPATGVIQMLRLTPRNHDGQYVVRLAHRRVGRLPARPARGRLRQHLPRLHRRRPVHRARRLGRGRGRDPQHRRRRARRDRAVSADRCSCARPPLTAADAAIAGFAAAARATRPAPTRSSSCTLCSRGLHGDDDLRHRSRPTPPPPRPRPSRSSAASARTSPTSSSPPRAASAFRRAMSAAISTAPTA